MNRIQAIPAAALSRYSKKRIILLLVLLSMVWIAISNILVFGIKIQAPVDLYVDLGVRNLILISPICVFLFYLIRYFQKYAYQIDQQYRALFENSPDPMWIYDIETLKFEVVNEWAVQFYGYSREEFLSMTIKEIRPQEEIPKLLKNLSQFREGHTRSGIWRHVKKDGTIFFVEILGFKITYQGRPAELIAVKDITKQIETELNLEISKRNTEALINNTNDLIWSTDTKMRLVYFNRAFSRSMQALFNHPCTAGSNLFDIGMVEEKKLKWESFYKRALAGEQFRVEDNGINEKGEEYFLEIAFNPIFNEQKEVIGTSCFGHDITKKKQVENKLRHLNTRYKILSRATNDAVWDWSLTNDSCVWNHGIKTIFGYEKEEADSDSSWWSDNIHPDDYSRVWGEIRNTFNNKKRRWESTYRFRCQNGAYKFVFDRGLVIYEKGNPVRMIGALQDIDTRTKALEEVKKLSLVARKTESSVIITNEDGKIEWVNKAFSKLTGYSKHEVIGVHPADLLHGPLTNSTIAQKMRDRLQLNRPVCEEILIYSKSGKKRWVSVNVTPILNEQGETYKHVAIQTDITRQKEFEQSIIAMANELSTLIENAHAVIFGVDQDGRINEWNKMCSRLTGFAKNEVIDKKLTEVLIAPENNSLITEIIQNALTGKSILNYELPVMTQDKQHRIILFNATARFNSWGDPAGILAVGQDVTELTEYRMALEQKVRERTKELANALEKEKQLVEVKNKFVSIASHEFRSPLAAINAVTGFIKNHKDNLSSGEMNDKLSHIENQVKHMGELLEDVLTIAKSDNNKIKVEKTKIDLSDFLMNVISDVEISTRQTHAIETNFRLPSREMITDEKILRQIFTNLFTNAIKFSPGKNKITLSVIGILNKVICEVRDYGVGIPPAEVEKIFEPFHRGSNVADIQGTGLGLSIVKRSIELLGGDITVQSQLSKGTVFKVVFESH